MRTPGNVKVIDNLVYMLSEAGFNRMSASHHCQKGQGGDDDEVEANVKTHVIAHTAANQIDAMGYDGDKAIEMLPEYIQTLQANGNANCAVISAMTDRFTKAIRKETE